MSREFHWGIRVSSDYDTVDRFLFEGQVVPESASVGDLLHAAEWLATYSAESAEDAQTWANVIGFLISSAETKANRSKLAQAKREFAQANGIQVSQVKVKREGK